MDLLISSLVGGFIRLILGVVLEDTLIKWRNCLARLIFKAFRKQLPVSTPLHLFLGPIETAEVLVDGDGETEYLPSTIVCHYDLTPIPLPPELEAIRERIEARVEQQRQTGQKYMWSIRCRHHS